jgi:2-keto-4-pentenoate hydratase/2-oxohepta-3-ene-1,7-dioic acid hydratase in catechol pathway
MKLCRYLDDGAVRIGRITGAEVVDISRFVDGPPSMRRLIEALPRRRGALDHFEGPRRPLAAVTLLAPIDDPQKFLAIGMNYRAHAEEAAAAGIPAPKSQLWFNKQVSCINGPTGAIELPKVSDQVDYEAELAVVIGQRCHDVSARDWQARSPTFTLGKSFDSHGPIGPWITTADEVEDPQDLVLSLSVNGEERQRASTRDMIYDIRQQIAYLSTVMTLEAGDILTTGTPAGVGIASGRFLQNGDVVVVEIAGLGRLRNRVVAEA